MPIHDWTKAPPGGFHQLHYHWLGALIGRLNSGVLPTDYFAYAELSTDDRTTPDVVTITTDPDTEGGLAVETMPPAVKRVATRSVSQSRRANRIVIRHPVGPVVAVVEIVSPGNKDSKNALRAFIRKVRRYLAAGVHLAFVDLLPPGSRDPQGLHPLIWGEFADVDFALPAGKPLTLASYQAGPTMDAYAECVAVGDALPDLPLFLSPGRYVPLPLEATYAAAWALVPPPIRPAVEA